MYELSGEKELKIGIWWLLGRDTRSEYQKSYRYGPNELQDRLNDEPMMTLPLKAPVQEKITFPDSLDATSFLKDTEPQPKNLWLRGSCDLLICHSSDMGIYPT